MKGYEQTKNRIFEIISKAEEGDRASEIFDWTIMILIALSILSIILESFENIYARHQSLFRLFEAITVIIFTIEYILRIWTADRLFKEAKHSRLKYIFSFMALIDLFAILPFFLQNPVFVPNERILELLIINNLKNLRFPFIISAHRGTQNLILAHHVFRGVT